MGKPIPNNRDILYRRQTRGTETSKYPEEEKTIVISLVVANERETAQTNVV
jgi:hypothetical protein